MTDRQNRRHSIWIYYCANRTVTLTSVATALEEGKLKNMVSDLNRWRPTIPLTLEPRETDEM